MQVVVRIFPLRRGLYEDYVANWWCATSALIKWKTIAGQVTLARAAAVATLAAAAPSMAQQIMSPSPLGLLMGMANSAFAFFMFGYQVLTRFGVVFLSFALPRLLCRFCPRTA
jgi:alpha-1,3-glucosyltransferase